MGHVNVEIYSYLIASMGDNFAARRAGKTPKNIPIEEEMPTATITEKRFIDAGKKKRMIKTTTIARISPKTPPKDERITASDRN